MLWRDLELGFSISKVEDLAEALAKADTSRARVEIIEKTLKFLARVSAARSGNPPLLFEFYDFQVVKLFDIVGVVVILEGAQEGV